jgi:valyl-tRNA synthetase
MQSKIESDPIGASVDGYWQDFEVAESGVIQFVVPEMQIYSDLPEDFDLDAERTRLSKAVIVAEKDRDSLAARLANPAFTERAKPEAVEKARADHAERAAEAERLAAALARLG